MTFMRQLRCNRQNFCPRHGLVFLTTDCDTVVMIVLTGYWGLSPLTAPGDSGPSSCVELADRFCRMASI